MQKNNPNFMRLTPQQQADVLKLIQTDFRAAKVRYDQYLLQYKNQTASS